MGIVFEEHTGKSFPDRTRDEVRETGIYMRRTEFVS